MPRPADSACQDGERQNRQARQSQLDPPELGVNGQELERVPRIPHQYNEGAKNKAEAPARATLKRVFCAELRFAAQL
jgi:hypothetical protein